MLKYTKLSGNTQVCTGRSIFERSGHKIVNVFCSLSMNGTEMRVEIMPTECGTFF